MLYRLEAHLSIVFAILVAVMLAVATTVPAGGREIGPFNVAAKVCDDIERKRAEFNEHGDRFGVSDTFDKAALEKLIVVLGAPPEMASRDATAAAFLVIGTSPKYPPGQVYFAVFDSGKCFVGNARAPAVTLFTFLGDGLPVPEPSGPSI